MSVFVDQIRSKSWILKITLMSLVLGMLLAVSLKTQQRVRTESGIPTTRLPGLAAAYTDAKRQNEKLRDQIEDLEKKITEYQNQLASGTTAAGTLNKELQESKFLAGLSAAEGPGVVITLRDNPRKQAPGGSPMDVLEGLIHDSDIQAVVNELRAAGAEVLSINDQRLIATSAIRCVGPVTLINGAPVAPPYEIKAIGDTKTLESALRLPGGVVDNFPNPEMIDIRTEARVVIKPYAGSRQFKWAEPVKE
ncbi:MAG: DUF881 domain-containing protein [Armatimonadetes bacterium]|nr:DUF881 domain-containing protein [Armatimonadota bacterium]